MNEVSVLCICIWLLLLLSDYIKWLMNEWSLSW
jgi:hypothetical protein